MAFYHYRVMYDINHYYTCKLVSLKKYACINFMKTIKATIDSFKNNIDNNILDCTLF